MIYDSDTLPFTYITYDVIPFFLSASSSSSSAVAAKYAMLSVMFYMLRVKAKPNTQYISTCIGIYISTVACNK